MELRRIQYFMEISKTGSFSKAATRLKLTQPALSHQIMLLEKETGYPLFYRIREGIRLTPEGNRFMIKAAAFIESYTDLMGSNENIRLRGSYTLAVGGTVAAWVLPEIMKNMNQKNSQISFDIREGDSEENKNALIRGDADLGILTGPIKSRGFQNKPFLKDEIVAVVSRDSPLALQKKISLRQLRKERFILFHPESSIRKLTDRSLHSMIQKNGHPAPLTELRSVESVLRFVKMGLGIGFISRLSLDEDLQLLDMPDFPVERTFYFCFRDSKEIKLLISQMESSMPENSSIQ